MKNIYKNSLVNLNKAKKILKKNNIIAVPTETVYGLAGNAYSNTSIKKIYKLKKRPKNNPLIVHYFNYEVLNNMRVWLDPETRASDYMLNNSRSTPL